MNLRSTTSANSLVVPFPEPNVAGNLLVAFVAAKGPIDSISDANGNSWYRTESKKRWRLNWKFPFLHRYHLSEFATLADKSGPNVVTVTATPGEKIGVGIAEVEDHDNSSSIEG